MLALSGCRFGDLLSAIDITKELMPKATLGRTGVEVSRLGLGCTPFNQLSDQEVESILQRALELGVTYVDVAPNYGTAEAKVGRAMKGFRDQLFLVSKTESPNRSRQGDDLGTWDLLQRSLDRLQTDYIDLVLLHNAGNAGRFPDVEHVYSDNGAMGALREAKNQGLIRYIGASGHEYPENFHSFLDKGDIDVLMNASNFVVRHSYNFEGLLWERARQENIGLVAMKVFGGYTAGQHVGRLCNDYYEESIRYALSEPDVAVAVIGVESVAHVERAAAAVRDFVPLSAEESAHLADVGATMAAEWGDVYDYSKR